MADEVDSDAGRRHEGPGGGEGSHGPSADAAHAVAARAAVAQSCPITDAQPRDNDGEFRARRGDTECLGCLPSAQSAGSNQPAQERSPPGNVMFFAS